MYATHQWKLLSIRHHVVNPDREPDPERAKAAAELIDVVRTYLK